jgi:hypothetical protein
MGSNVSNTKRTLNAEMPKRLAYVPEAGRRTVPEPRPLSPIRDSAVTPAGR